MEKGLVSVIITTYKRPANILARAITSVQKQTYTNYELVVVNDAPDYPGRPEIDWLVKEKNVKYLVNNQSIGAGASRNRGADVTNGEYLAYLDDDDEWIPNKLETIIPYFKDQRVGLVYSDMEIHNNLVTKIVNVEEYDQRDVVKHLLSRNYIGGFSNPVFRRIFFDECGKMDESLLSSQDADLWRRLAQVSFFVHVNEPLVRYYESTEGNITGNPYKRIQGTLALIKKYDGLYKKYPHIRKMHINRSTQNYIRAGWFKDAMAFYKEVYNPLERLLNLYVIPIGLLKMYYDKFFNN